MKTIKIASHLSLSSQERAGYTGKALSTVLSEQLGFVCLFLFDVALLREEKSGVFVVQLKSGADKNTAWSERLGEPAAEDRSASWPREPTPQCGAGRWHQEAPATRLP